MGNVRKRTGTYGERAALTFLQQQGYQILDTNYRCPIGEIDIVARDGECLSFVEVRTKRSLKFGTPEESITPYKKTKLIDLAHSYLQNHPGSPESWRIDVIAIEIDKANKVQRIELIEDAIHLD